MLLAKKIRKVFLGLVALCIMVGCIKTSYIPSIQFNVQAAGVFNTYNLTETELIKIASLCQQEQGTAKGAAAEASLMANRFEMYGSKFSSVYDYARNSGWFAKAGTYMDKMNATDAVIEAVRNVLIYGKRTLPGYIDEHDCFSDLKSCTNNGVGITITNRSQYKQFVTIINNVYGSKYTFYCFPTSSSDPFGYISETKRSQSGEAYYDYDTGELINGRDPIPELVTPIISTDKSLYNVGDTINISWAASPSNSNLSHYWLNIINPDGTWTYGGTMNKNTSYSFIASQAGSYSITTYATPKGSMEGEGSLTDTKTIIVKNRDPVFNVSSTSVNINMENNEEKNVEFSYSDYSGPVTISFSHDRVPLTNLKWGEWSNNSIKLYISGMRTGTEVVKVTYTDTETKEILYTASITVTILGEFRVTPDRSNCTLNLEKKQDADITFYCYNVPSEGLIDLVDENNVPIDNSNGIITGELQGYKDGNQLFFKASIKANKTGKSKYYFTYTLNGVRKDMAVVDIEVYERDPVIIFHDYDTGEVIEKRQAEYGKTYGNYFPDISTLIGVDFLGWFTKPKGGMLIKEDTVISTSKNIDLYMHLNIPSSTILFNSNFDDRTQYVFILDDIVDAAHGDKICDYFPEIPEEYAGAFDGWYTEKEGGRKIGDEETVYFQQMGFINLYAHWNYIKGDANFDGKVNISDAVILQKWLLGSYSSYELKCWKNVDLCEDDRLDVFDLCLMKRMLVENS